MKNHKKTNLESEYPLIAKEWDYEKNKPLHPSDFACKSSKKVWWKCKDGHSWQAIISNRTQHNRGCPYCAHQLPIVGKTDFESVCPSIAMEWHPTKNGTLKPSDVMYGTHKKVWWFCRNCGYEWQTEVKIRYAGSGNCPRCNQSKLIIGENDLASKRPDLIPYWHPSKNLPYTPSDYSYGSGKKVWWICKHGHEYQMSIYNKTKGESCPVCNNRRRTSFPEQAIYYYIKKVYPNALNSYKAIFTGSMELDIYIPEIMVGIEYDGKIYHKDKTNKERDIKKYRICKENGIHLIRIANTEDSSIGERSDYYIHIKTEKESDLELGIRDLFSHLHKDLDVNIKRDRISILHYLESLDVSLASEYPDIAREFDEEKNNPLKADLFHPGSNERVWWKCSICGYRWRAQINMRTKEGNGCPECAKIRGGKRKSAFHLEHNGSLEKTNPELLAFWNYEKNPFSPSEIIASTTKIINWRCEKGHEWKASGDHVIRRGLHCPYCLNKRILTGFNDLATLRPDLLVEWNYGKNIDIDPNMVGAGTAKKAWWKCQKCGFEWETRINLRNKGCGCPNCANLRKIGNKYAQKKKAT